MTANVLHHLKMEKKLFLKSDRANHSIICTAFFGTSVFASDRLTTNSICKFRSIGECVINSDTINQNKSQVGCHFMMNIIHAEFYPINRSCFRLAKLQWRYTQSEINMFPPWRVFLKKILRRIYIFSNERNFSKKLLENEKDPPKSGKIEFNPTNSLSPPPVRINNISHRWCREEHIVAMQQGTEK